jgi:lysophospholipase L1-like esterase
MKYLALGDSYTIGESVAPLHRWPVLLTQLLQKRGLEIGQPLIIAQTGWTTSELAQAIAAQQLHESFDLVSLLIGVNNQYRGLSVAEFRAEFRDLLRLSIDLATDGRPGVFVLSIPDWGVSPFAQDRDSAAIASQIDEFNQVIVQECELQKITFIDVTALSRLAQNNPQLIAEDGLHFSGNMYQLWAEACENSVLKMLYKVDKIKAV